jgi:hypothetical protein
MVQSSNTASDLMTPKSLAPDQINSMVVETRWGDREFQLLRGDITKLNLTIDLMVISSIGSDFTPTKNSIIGALYRNHQISVAQLSEEPEFTLAQPLKLWVSRDTGHSEIRRIMCVEIPIKGKETNRIVEDAFFALPLLEARQLSLSTICLPVLATGDHGLNPKEIISPMLKGAAWALRNLESADRVCFVVRKEEHAKLMNEALNTELGRANVKLSKNVLVDGIRQSIIDRLETLRKLDHRMDISLFSAKLSDNSTSDQIGMAARQLREYVINQIVERHLGSREAEFQALKEKGIAEWIISYLNLLRTIGNEIAHEPMDRRESESRRPPRLESGDLALCLFVIEKVLHFWMDWLSDKKPSTRSTGPSRG